jgi:hypothetical protein
MENQSFAVHVIIETKKSSSVAWDGDRFASAPLEESYTHLFLKGSYRKA